MNTYWTELGVGHVLAWKVQAIRENNPLICLVVHPDIMVRITEDMEVAPSVLAGIDVLYRTNLCSRDTNQTRCVLGIYADGATAYLDNFPVRSVIAVTSRDSFSWGDE